MTDPRIVALPWTRALVVGLGRSGLAAARLLVRGGVAVVGYDQRGELDGVPAEIETHLGDPQPPDGAFAGVDLIVLSPGVPPAPILAQARSLAPDATVHGELSLALALIDADDTPWPRIPTVLVTGTNGKSTVTALIGSLLEGAGRRVFAGGNLGEPLTDVLARRLEPDRAWPEVLVLECSSFQLETFRPYPADVAIVVNVSADHLDRYPSLAAYAGTKAKVFSGLGPGGLAVLDADDAWTPRLEPANVAAAHVGGTPGGTIEGDGEGNTLVLDDGERYDRSLLALPGRHNAKNALFALLAARHLGVDPAACRRGLAAFTGLPHRMERVRELDGVTYYDDSKATNVASVVAGLGGLDRRVVLVAGGRRKGDDLTALVPLFGPRIGALVAIGEASAELVRLAGDVIEARAAESIDEAVLEARRLARPGDAVVLSPACASYDQFGSYAERGAAFAAAVRALT